VSTALVPVAVGRPSRDAIGRLSRPRADFLAQLIATAAQVPQTRTRRRADPAEAVAIYSAMEQRVAVRHLALSRSL
jgi:hypothetical protein